MRARRSLPSSVVWVRSPVKTMKSGCLARPFTVATAFSSVCSASGFAGPLVAPVGVGELHEVEVGGLRRGLAGPGRGRR